SKGLEIIEGLRGHTSGYAVPTSSCASLCETPATCTSSTADRPKPPSVSFPIET
ncbi:hypothetical protein ACT453_29335, partial [Bacillus sp. D-CC]